MFLVTGSVANQVPTFRITDINFHIPVFTLSTQDNAKLLKQLESSFKRIIDRVYYQSKIKTQLQN